MAARADGAGAAGFDIGLVNNMPDAALRATEQQFRDLLQAAAAGRELRLHLVALPAVPRGPVGQRVLERRYRGPELLEEVALDGLIVTGTEPRDPRLDREPYWDEFVRLIDWARGHTTSAVWSCLAAHAAVLQLDGVERRRFPDKLFGLYDCPVLGRHPLCAGLGTSRCVPQSRFNDLPQEQLERAGYEVLACAQAVGADFFVKDCGSLFLFLQGHPEYDRHALAREYRRDVARYLAGEREAYPRLPHDYFAAPVEAQMRRFSQRARASHAAAEPRGEGLLADFPAPEDTSPAQARWRDDAVRLYANWLDYIEAQRS
jgi:homoserine O-succinyltransferase